MQSFYFERRFDLRYRNLPRMRTSLLLILPILFLALVSCKPSQHVVFIHDQEKNTIKPCSVLEEDINCRVEDSATQTWIVDAVYHDSVEETGWVIAEYTLSPDVDPNVLAYGAGYAEGFLSYKRINQHWNNTLQGFCDIPDGTPSCRKIMNFFQANLDWMKSMIEESSNDPYWIEVKKGLLQVQGLIDGYHNEEIFNPTIRIKPHGLFLFQLDGDLADLEMALNVTDRFFKRFAGSESCSGFVKMVDTDLFTAHATWTDYQMMLRMIKRFNFPSHTETFTGYPGPIFSGDDFYILSTGLVAIETTNQNNNPLLYKYITPNSTLEWMRNIVANRLAKNGQEWCEIFAKHNSGTYNNQWMIVDYNAFENHQNTGILHVLEQLPGEIVFKDVTDVLLNQSYWASYNIPYFKKIFEDSGQDKMVEKYGKWFTHENNPRARIFARDHKKVTDVDSVVKLMRYNDFKNDPLSRCECTPPYSAVNAIAARCDLNAANGTYAFPLLKQRNLGATDVKVTSDTLRRSFSLIAECGPTHDQQPAFVWSKSPYASVSHEGHPDKFDFQAELITWEK